MNEPDINYGLMRSIFTLWIPKYSIKYSNTVICVSNYSKKELIKHINRNDILLIYNAIDTDKFRPPVDIRKENIVLTVGNLYKSTFKLKGLQTFFDAAKDLPDVQFILIGDIDYQFKNTLSHKIPDNIFLTGRLTAHHLLPLFQKAKVYCQLSYIESFGVALAEAMSCECVPVITNRGALPEVAGTVGYYVSYGDVASTVEAIRAALTSDEGKNARKRIVEKFSIANREKDLSEIIKNL
ncbi:MAG: glycosyltransferase family 4 protein [Candidatus Methanoperedens sp.]|nr:glycosyltransferase family 4 protein [Candidatus Methanoperedens sp.]